MKKIYILCGSKIFIEENQNLKNYVEKLKKEGHIIFVENQGIETVEVCKEKVLLIKNSDEVHVFCEEVYQEVLFGLGVTFSLGKSLVIVHAPSSILTMLLDWEDKIKLLPTSEIVGKPHISQFEKEFLAFSLIRDHTDGKIEKEEDLEKAVSHCNVTLNFTKETIENTEGTLQEKALKLLEVRESLENFKIKNSEIN